MNGVHSRQIGARRRGFGPNACLEAMDTIMNRVPFRSPSWLLVVLMAAPGVWAQKEPRIGYVYPAGGQKGSSFEATIGGQFLADCDRVSVTGDGVGVRVLEHTRPLTPKELNELRQKTRKLQTLLGNLEKNRGKPGHQARVAEATKLAGEIGLEKADRMSLNEFRRKLFDPKKQLNPQISETVRVEVELAPDAPPGKRDLRLITPAGISNPLVFQVGQCPEHLEREPNERPADSEAPLELPGVLNGQILPGDVDRFRIHAHQGDRLVAAVSARKLIPYLADAVPGWFQATLTLYDEEGREVAYSDDYRFIPDPVIATEIPEDGVYVLEIRDAIYRGREDFVYRITLGEIPFVTSVFPLGGPVEKETLVSLKGWNIPVDTLKVRPEKSSPAVRPVRIASQEDGAPTVPFAVDTLPESLEEEPDNGTSDAQAIELPRIVNGRIDHPGDVDVFQIEGQVGEEIFVEVQARRLGSPLDSILKVLDRQGRLLAANDDHEDPGAGLTTHHADSRLHFRVGEKGPFYIRLADAQNKGGEAYAYRLRISHEHPDFKLRVVPSTINARAGAIVPITVYAMRQDGFAGDIALELKGAPEGFTLSGGWVPGDQDRVQCTLTVPSKPEKRVSRLRLEGQAQIGDRKVIRQAVPAEDRMQAFIYHHLVPSETWTVAINGKPRGGQPLTLLEEEPVKLAGGETTRVRIAGPRGRFARQIQLELTNPPAGIRVKGLELDDEGPAILLSAAKEKTPAGLKGNLIVHAFTVREFKARNGKVQRRRVPVGTLPAIPFEVVGP